jgi:hypothetical protein
LRPATRAWFSSVLAEYQLEPHHIRLLTLAAESWDRCCEAREAAHSVNKRQRVCLTWSSTVPSLANCTRTNACELCRGAVGPAKLRRRLNDRPLVPLRSTSSARLFDGITPWDGNIPETDNPPWRSSVGRATWLSRSRCFPARMIGRQGLTHVRLGQAELARNARRRDASLECSANGVQLTTSQRGLS